MCKRLATNRAINGSANSIIPAYDAMSRVTGITNPLGAFGYTYVDESTGSDKGTTRLAQMTYPNGQVTNYSYFGSTGDERLEQIGNLNSSGGILSQFGYGYDAEGQITLWKQQTDSNAATRFDTAYDPAGQLISAVRKTDATNAVLKQYYYNYDAAANRTSEQVDGSVTQTGVNSVNQITGQTAGGATRFQGTISDPGTVKVNGQAATMPTLTNFVANPSLNSGTNTVAVVATDGSGNAQTNNYQVVVPAGTAVSPTYDAAGNMVNNGNGQTYSWDAENRLVEITQGSNTYQFAYDGLGRRVSETDNGTLARQWVWVGSTLSEERDASGTVTKRFYAQGEQIGSSSYYYAFDHLGSVREMTDSSGTIQARYDYDPYGRTTLVSGTNLSDFQYAGMYMHQTSGLYLTPIGNTYDPTVGRWIGRDPLGEGSSLNLYAYVDSDPINEIDPLGLTSMHTDFTDAINDVLNRAANPDAPSNSGGCPTDSPPSSPASPPDFRNGFEKFIDDIFGPSQMSAMAASQLGPLVPGGGPKLSPSAQKLLGNLKNMANQTVQDAIRARGGTASNVNNLETGMAQKTVGEVAEAAAKGDPAAVAAIKAIKQASTKGQRY